MKKKVKLFITFASLCLSIALLTFGVYAATSVTYTISGTVSYTVADVYATVTTTVQPLKSTSGKYAASFADAAAVTTAGNGAESTDWDTDAGGVAEFKTYDATSLAPKSDNFSKTGIAINLNTSSIWRIQIKVDSNSASAGVSVTITSAGLGGTSTNVLWAAGATYSSPVSVSASGSTTLTYYVALHSTLENISGATWSIALTLAKPSA